MTDQTATNTGWYPDPSGRHELRFRNGEVWTPQVSDRGRTGRDPMGVPKAPAKPPERGAATFETTVRIAYRVGLIGFLLGGGIGAFTGQDGGGLADEPAVWVASNAIGWAFQFGVIATVVGGIVGVVLASMATPVTPAQASAPQVRGPGID